MPMSPRILRTTSSHLPRCSHARASQCTCVVCILFVAFTRHPRVWHTGHVEHSQLINTQVPGIRLGKYTQNSQNIGLPAERFLRAGNPCTLKARVAYPVRCDRVIIVLWMSLSACKYTIICSICSQWTTVQYSLKILHIPDHSHGQCLGEEIYVLTTLVFIPC